MNRHPLTSNKGYTMVETLFVLALFLMVISISFISFKPLYQQLYINHFFQQLQKDVSYAQLYAISHSQFVHIFFFPEHHFYEIQADHSSQSLIKRSYSKNIQIHRRTLPSTVTFLINGTLKKAGKMDVIYHDDKYVFVFLFGKGQTYVEKQ